MASSRIGNASPSEFRLVLTKLTEVQKKLDTTDQSSVIAQLRQVNDSLQIVEGNQTDISDAEYRDADRDRFQSLGGEDCSFRKKSCGRSCNRRGKRFRNANATKFFKEKKNRPPSRSLGE